MTLLRNWMPSWSDYDIYHLQNNIFEPIMQVLILRFYYFCLFWDSVVYSFYHMAVSPDRFCRLYFTRSTIVLGKFMEHECKTISYTRARKSYQGKLVRHTHEQVKLSRKLVKKTCQGKLARLNGTLAAERIFKISKTFYTPSGLYSRRVVESV